VELQKPGFPNPSLVVDEATGFSVNSFSIPTAAGTVIGGITAFCEPSDAEVVRYGGNISPHVNWKSVPEGTKSFALVVADPDAPATGELANKKGTALPASFERADFYHWVVADIPATAHEIPEAASGRGVTEGGKKPTKRTWGVEGVNSFGLWFADDPKMAGDYFGWDGPCPPWNDERVHRYVFNLYALDLPSLGLSGPFTGPDVLAKIEGHVVAKASFSGIYSINIAAPSPLSP
jgi:Raf kinase inhibitor-like YbhB/YbcL family protein